jgi:outer membrane protein
MKTIPSKLVTTHPRLMFVTVLLFISTLSPGQGLSLDDCIRLALSNNEQVNNSALDITSSAYRTREVKSALLPTVNLTSQYLYYTEVPSQYAPATAFGGPAGEYSKLTLNLAQNTSAYIQSSVNLYNKGVITGLQTARVMESASHLRLAQTQEDVIYNVTATYYTIQILQDNLLRLEGNITNLEKTVKINEALKENELVPDNVHNRLLINLENLKNQYETQRLSLERNETLLRYLMNKSVHEKLSIAPLDYNTILEEPGNVDIPGRTDIRLQEAQIELSKLDKKSVLAGYYPTLSANMSFGYAGYYDDMAPGKLINDDWINSSSIALSLRIPLFDGFQKHFSAKQKDVAIRKNINMLSMMKANAEREVVDAANNYVTNRKQLTNSKASLDLAEELFKSAQSEFENGITSTTELLNAQTDLSNAMTNYSTAMLNLKLAELSLRKASGTLANDYN